ncbi:MAG: sodium-dependent transporter [Methanosphaera sp.]|uniref:sodium-dependent transporter n=1 Tax=Methanosphaera sp. TaxID=2666342 RepID=UPI0025FDB754|nr:sodium-dependent transporter [Methanosphaera sp.]MDD6535103.1 sodium-dependent transporter [Methanosphaera sp.]MDY3955913.1 sodium-dependent transporter [Methanosphaera sp.]
MTDSSDEVKKNQWDSSFSFLMAMIGAAVGLGNIWRFSYVVYSQGGGSFFIPYFFAILIMGIPFLILEYGLGFKFKDSLSNILKKIKPKFEVVGWFVAFLVFLVLTYYIVIMGWDLIYLILSFFKGWGADPNMYFNTNIVVGGNNLNGIFTPVVAVTAAVIFIWAVLWYISHKSVDGISKAVKFLIPVLFIMMGFIVIYALTLPGKMIGLTALFTPDWSALGNVEIWLAAFGQILFSLSMGQAIAVTYASYLPSKSKLIDNVLIVVASNSLFEIFTAVGVFSILGFMSLRTGLPIEQIATSGTGLLFVVFPEIFNIMGDVAYIIAPLFFLCVFFAGLSTIIAYLEPMSMAITKKFKLSRFKVTTILTVVGLILSFVYTTASGNFLLTIADEYLNQFAILLGVILQAIIVAWYYGCDKLLGVLNESSTFNVGRKWILIIKVALPIILTILWLQGLRSVLLTGDFTVQMIELVITILFIAVPVILTLLPGKDKDDGKIKAIEE